MHRMLKQVPSSCLQTAHFALCSLMSTHSSATDVNKPIAKEREREREGGSCGVRIRTMLLLSCDDDADVGEKAAAANHDL